VKRFILRVFVEGVNCRSPSCAVVHSTGADPFELRAFGLRAR
jgi:hypothetical protein